MKLDRKAQLSIAYAVLTVLMLLLMQQYFDSQVESLSYTEFRRMVAEGQVFECNIGSEAITGTYIGLDGDRRSFTVAPIEDPGLTDLLLGQGVEVSGKPANPWFTSLLSWIPIILIFALFWTFMARRMGGGSGGLMSIGKSKAKVYMEKGTGITFGDVAGIDEAKEELEEVVEFLKTPERFQALGGRIPRGVLLVGPPGTGKTLLAKAVAGEAGVPFFSISGSDFVEMFVGVGAARVRDLFDQAKKHAPAIVFIDELDALGKARGGGYPGGHDEREQTLNQLLTELDGFETNDGVILMAATNRPEILDPALLRPGRFDRRVGVERPDVKGREAILKIHAKTVKLSDDVDLPKLAVRTPGLAGADLANVVNEAALLAARRNKKAITMPEFDEAIERTVAGLERKSRVITDKERRVIAYHEAGHAVVGSVSPYADPVQKISIVSRGSALGYVLNMPLEDRYTQSKEELLAKITTALGGRAAEEVFFGESWTGVTADLQTVAAITEAMVKEYGMSEELGLVAHSEDRRNAFLNMGPGERAYSEETARRIDAEVSRIVESCYGEATKILRDNRRAVERVVEVLLDTEVMDGEQLRAIICGTESRTNGKESGADGSADGTATGVAEASSGTDSVPPSEHEPRAGA